MKSFPYGDQHVHTTGFGVNYLPHIKYAYLPWRDVSGRKVQGRRDLANSPPTQNNNNLSDASSRPSSPAIDHPFVPREEDRRGDGRIPPPGAGRSLADDDVVPRQ